MDYDDNQISVGEWLMARAAGAGWLGAGLTGLATLASYLPDWLLLIVG